MHIEFHTPEAEVKDWVLTYLRDKLLEFYHRDKEISAAHVYLRQPGQGESDKVCEVELTIFGDSVFVRTRADSYEQASREAIEELEKLVEEQIRKQSEPPDEMVSTVKV